MEAAIHASAVMHAEGPFSCVIIDSVMSLFRTEFCGRGELAERQQTLAKHLSQLHRLATEHNVAVIMINQCMADPGVSLFRAHSTDSILTYCIE